MKPLNTVEVYRQRRIMRTRQMWRWRLRDGGNHKILATGSEAYANRADLDAVLEDLFPYLPVVEVKG